MTLPDFEDKLLQIMNHTAQDLGNANVAQAKTNVKGEIENLSLKLENGEINIPVDNLLPGNLGATMDIAAGGAVISAGARMDDGGLELTDAVPSEASLPSAQSGDWFTNAPSSTGPSVHSGVGFYNDNALNSRGISIRASGAAAGSKVGRVHISADNGDQNLAGATSAEIHLSSVNSGNAFINLIAETHVVDGALIVDSEAAHFHQGLAVNNSLADINAGANVAGGLTTSGGNTLAGGATITGQLTNQNGAIFNTGLQSNNALADINAGANVAGGLTVTGGVTLSGQLTNNNGAIFNTGFESQGARSYVDAGLTIRGSSFTIEAPGVLNPTLQTTSSTLTAGSAATASHGLGTVPRYVIAQVKESVSTVWKIAGEGIAPGPSQFSIGVDANTVYFNNNESVTCNFRVQYFE